MSSKRVLIFALALSLAHSFLGCSGSPTGADEFDTEENSYEASSDDGDTEDLAQDGGTSKDDEKLAQEADSDALLDADPLQDSKEAEQPKEAEVVTKDEPAPNPETTPTASGSDTVVSQGGESQVIDSTASDHGTALISNIRFEANEGAGSIIVEGNKQLDYTTRFNSPSNQYVVEIKNAKLPKKLTRPFITKDFQGQIGSIDAYQSASGDTVNVVVQLRGSVGEPTIHAEGSSIIIIPGGAGDSSKIADSSNENEGEVNILSSRSLEEFLSDNVKFYGKKISIEVQDIDVRSAINLIAEESGANLVMSDSVKGSLAIKLKNVPWDQALALILKTKKLGYTRQGSVLRISPMSEIKQEEEDALKIAESRKKVEPLKVQMIPINYAKITDLQGQLKGVMSERGTIVADGRTNSLIVTDTEEILDRAKKIISSLDLAPAQVLIEGKLVEARENFNKRVGINWDIAGAAVGLGSGSNGPVNLVPNLSIRPSTATGGSLGFNLTLGTLDVLGDLNAVLALEENAENVRVISSPRIVALHNEEASITQTASVPVLASVNTKDGIKSYKDLNLKMDLRVTPQVANNGFVQLKVEIVREFLGAVRDDGSAGSHHRTASTKVMVKSGQTAVIGGIYQNDSSQMEAGVPVLKDIPVLGFLFRGRSYHKDKTELLLFLTPRVLSQVGAPTVAQDANDEAKLKE